MLKSIGSITELQLPELSRDAAYQSSKKSAQSHKHSIPVYTCVLVYLCNIYIQVYYTSIPVY